MKTSRKISIRSCGEHLECGACKVRSCNSLFVATRATQLTIMWLQRFCSSPPTRHNSTRLFLFKHLHSILLLLLLLRCLRVFIRKLMISTTISRFDRSWEGTWIFIRFVMKTYAKTMHRCVHFELLPLAHILIHELRMYLCIL